ncbi:MAG: DUF397 domain-containing protein [Solirubrobacteraceae bacterium]
MIARNDGQQQDPRLSRATWRKSRHSGTEDGCVETAFLSDGHVAIRDSKDRSGPALIYTPREWAAFVAGVKDGEFELPDRSPRRLA